jgi:hypothetical protein
MENKLIGTIDCTPKLKAYWKCQVTEFNGSVLFVNIEKGNSAAQNILTLGYKYKSVTFEEAYISNSEYEQINFTDFK